MAVYIINSSNNLKHFKSLILILIVVPMGIYFIVINRYGYFNANVAYTIGSFTLLAFIVPHLVLHLNYFLQNRRDVLQINNSSKLIVYMRKGQPDINFTIKDIDIVIIVKSRPFSENRLHIFPWDIYHYFTIKLKDGRKIIITSLLAYKLDFLIKFKKVKLEKKLYTFITPEWYERLD